MFSKQSKPRITKECLFRHSYMILLVFHFCIAGSGQTIQLPQNDLDELVEQFKTSNPKDSVLRLADRMPKPRLDPIFRESIINSLPPVVFKLQVKNSELDAKVKELFRPVLKLYGREDVYEIIIIDSQVPFVMTDSGVVIVISTGILKEAESDDEILGLISHEIGHDYYLPYSIDTKQFLEQVKANDREPFLIRHSQELLTIIEYECDAFSAVTLAYLGYRPIAFLDKLEKWQRQFPNNIREGGIHPALDKRRGFIKAILPVQYLEINKPRVSPSLEAIHKILGR